jgi:hypothetical protein
VNFVSVLGTFTSRESVEGILAANM